MSGAKHIRYLLIFLLVPTIIKIGRTSTPPCEEFVKFIYETNFKFSYRSQRFSPIHFVGFRFSKPLKKFEIFGARTKHKLDNVTWLVREEKSFSYDALSFDVVVTFFSFIASLQEIFINGDRICSRVDAGGEANHLDLEEDRKEMYELATLILLIVCSALLGAIVAVSIFGLLRIRKWADTRWHMTHTLVSAMERSLSENNPNRKGIPLPIPPGGAQPGGEQPIPGRRDTYIKLDDSGCKNPRCNKTYSLLVGVVDQLPEGAKSQFDLSDYMVSRRSVPPKRDVPIPESGESNPESEESL